MMNDDTVNGVRALVVGRDVRSMAIIRDAAERIGLSSSYASTIPEAVADAHHHRPALLIVEVNLDKLQSGLWLARTMRAHYNVSVIFVTEHPDEEVQRQIAESGGGGIFKRPFHRSQLVQSLRLAIDWHHLRTSGRLPAPSEAPGEDHREECAS